MLKPEKVKILIVEDDLEQQRALADYLRLFQFDVQLARGAKDALKRSAEEEFQIIFIDTDLQEMPGLELIKMIRTVHAERPKILLLSGFLQTDVSELFAAGVDGFFVKPFHAAAVRAAIQLTILNRAERWTLPLTPPTKIVSTHKLVERGRSLSDKNIFSFGRQGFFLRKSGVNFAVDDRVEFDFTFEAKEPLERLRGVGVVRWFSDLGAGIEILQIDAAQIEKFVSWLESAAQPANIPVA